MLVLLQDHMVGRGVAVLEKDVPLTARLVAALMYADRTGSNKHAAGRLGELETEFRATLHDPDDDAAAGTDADGPNKGMYLPKGELASAVPPRATRLPSVQRLGCERFRCSYDVLPPAGGKLDLPRAQSTAVPRLVHCKAHQVHIAAHALVPDSMFLLRNTPCYKPTWSVCSKRHHPQHPQRCRHCESHQRRHQRDMPSARASPGVPAARRRVGRGAEGAQRRRLRPLDGGAP